MNGWPWRERREQGERRPSGSSGHSRQVAPGLDRGAVRESMGLIVVLVAIVALFSVTTEHFFTRVTFTTLANQLPALAVIVVGMTLVLIARGIDLSVGSVMALAAAVLGVALTRWHWPVVPALAACVGVGVVAGKFLPAAVNVEKYVFRGECVPSGAA